MYQLKNAADAEPFVYRLRHAIARKMPMTITYREQKKLPDGTRSKNEFEIVVRTIEPYAVEVSKMDRVPLIRAIDRVDGMPKSFRMDRVLYYSLHRSVRLMEHAY